MWSEIEAVAKALLEHKTIKGSEVRSIVAGAPSSRRNPALAAAWAKALDEAVQQATGV